MPFVNEKRLQQIINYGLGMNEDCLNCPLEESKVPCAKRLGLLNQMDCETALYNYLTETINTERKEII